MPDALLMAFPIVGGFLAITTLHATRFKVARTSGHRLYFTIVNYALLLTCAAALITQIIWSLSAWTGAVLVAGPIPTELLRSIEAGLFGTLDQHKWPIATIAFALGHIAHGIFNSEDSKQRYIEVAIAGQDFERMVAESQKTKKPMLITLDTGKVYLGWAVDGPNPGLQRMWVRILPWASGYRNQSQQVRFVTNYTSIIDRIERQDPKLEKALKTMPSIKDFEVVLPVENIVAVHLFDVAVYKLLDSDGAKMFEEMAYAEN